MSWEGRKQRTVSLRSGHERVEAPLQNHQQRGAWWVTCCLLEQWWRHSSEEGQTTEDVQWTTMRGGAPADGAPLGVSGQRRSPGTECRTTVWTQRVLRQVSDGGGEGHHHHSPLQDLVTSGFEWGRDGALEPAFRGASVPIVPLWCWVSHRAGRHGGCPCDPAFLGGTASP